MFTRFQVLVCLSCLLFICVYFIVKACFGNSTNIGLNTIFVRQINTATFPDLNGLTVTSLPALSLYQGTRLMNVIPNVQPAMIALKIPQWGG